MKKSILILPMLIFALQAQAADVRYSIGIEVDGEPMLNLAYNAIEVNEGKTLENILNKKMEQKYLDGFNSGDRMGKLATLKLTKAGKIGDLEVPAGEYPCGFNGDAEGNFFFVVWKGEEALKTKIALEKHEAAVIPNLTLMVGPGETEDTCVITALYGKYYSHIPVAEGKN